MVHPGTGKTVEIWSDFSWACLFGGAFWYANRRMWFWAVICLMASIATWGIALVWFSFACNDQHVKWLEAHGYKWVKLEWRSEKFFLIQDELDVKESRIVRAAGKRKTT